LPLILKAFKEDFNLELYKPHLDIKESSEVFDDKDQD
jgi:hypothetical protein